MPICTDAPIKLNLQVFWPKFMESVGWNPNAPDLGNFADGLVFTIEIVRMPLKKSIWTQVGDNLPARSRIPKNAGEPRRPAFLRTLLRRF